MENEKKIKQIKQEIKALTEERKELRAYAMRLYLDPIDFPQEVKRALQNKSYLKGLLKEKLNNLKH